MPRAGLDSDLVVEAAAIIVSAGGPGALTLARVAADLGVAPPSLYKHIAGLDDLVLKVTTLAIHRLTDTLMEAALGRSGRQALLAIAEAYRLFAIEHIGLYSLTQAALHSGSTAQRAATARMVKIIGAVLRGYGVPDDLSIHAIRMVRAGLHGFSDIEARGGFQMPYSVDDSFQLLIDVLDASLRNLGKQVEK